MGLLFLRYVGTKGHKASEESAFMNQYRWRALGWWTKTCIATAGFVVILCASVALVLALTAPDPALSAGAGAGMPGYTVPITHALFPLLAVVLISLFTRVQSALNVRHGDISTRPRS